MVSVEVTPGKCRVRCQKLYFYGRPALYTQDADVYLNVQHI
jgi:hypothetical protein